LPCDERHPIRPQCQYGISKHTVEHYLDLYSDLYALDYTVLRYPNVYGPRQDPDGEAGVVAIFGGRMLDNQPVTIFGDGTQQRDFVFVGDVARANLLAVERGSRAIVNIGSNLGTSVLDIFEALKSVTGYGLDPIFAPPRLGEVYQIYLTGGLALQLLGWQPTVTLQDGLRQTVSAMQGLHRSMLVPVPD
jgi:UDP-glucose 4-epimerase